MFWPVPVSRDGLVTLACLVLLLACPGDGDVGTPLPNVESCLVYRGLGPLDDAAPSFEQYKDLAARVLPGGGWVTEGDLIFESEEDLWLHYRRKFAQPTESAAPSFRSLVTCVNSDDMGPYEGFDRVWNVHRKLNLTFCYGEFQNEELREEVEAAVAISTEAWERAADVNFIRVNPPDGQCQCGFDPNPDPGTCPDKSYQVKIRIRQGLDDDVACVTTREGGKDCPLGQAGYPNVPDFNVQDARFRREVKIWPEALTSSNIPLQTTVHHELGHILGFGHEFSRWTHSTPKCIVASDGSWRSVTDADSSSVMGYYYCHNTFNMASSPTALDRLGLSYLYNLPRYTRTRLDEKPSDDIIWHRPGHETYEVWRTTPSGSSPIIFVKTPYCYDGNTDPSQCATKTPEHVKPLPLRAGPDHRGFFLLGLSDIEDSMRDHAGVESMISAVVNSTVDVPLVGRFLGEGEDEDLWFVRPGPSTDSAFSFDGVEFDEMLSYGSGAASLGFYRPLTGLWAPQFGVGEPGTQVLWYRESGPVHRLTYLNGDRVSASETTFGSCSGLSDPVGLTGEYIPLLGNFDGDPATEIFWASTQPQRPSVLYHTPAPLAGDSSPDVGLCFAVTVTIDWNTIGYKAFVGDFNGDAIDDIFWYRSGGQFNNDVLMLFSENGAFTTLVMHQDDDFTPFVGDFNGDECDDILWYAPHKTYQTEPLNGGPLTLVQGTSPLWRSACNDTGRKDASHFLGFVEDRPVEIPVDSYPVGYNPRIGRWAQ